MKVIPGQKATRSITLTAGHIKTCAQLTGDHNPLHFDEAFAAETNSSHAEARWSSILHFLICVTCLVDRLGRALTVHRLS